MTKQLKNGLTLGLGLLAMSTTSAFAVESSDSKPALATITVVQAIELNKVDDLEFPDAAQGAAAFTVDPSVSEAANFTVSGAPDAAFSTSVEETSITMTTGSGLTVEEQIVVDQFLANAPAQLDGLGSASFGVGARRAQLDDQQAPGNYQGTFNVTVSYE